MFRKFQISNPLPNRYFPKIDVGGPCFYHDQSTYQIKKNVGEFFRSSINVCIEVQKKRNLSCAVIYVLIRREIAVGLIPSVKKPPSPSEKIWEGSPSSTFFLKRGGCLYKLNNAESPRGDQEILNQHLGQAVLLFQRRIYSQQTKNKKRYDFLL